MSKLRKWQVEAKNKVLTSLKSTDRCRVVAPTGIGKTRLGIEINKKFNKTLIVSVSGKILQQYYDSLKTYDPKREILVVASKVPPGLDKAVVTPAADVDKVKEWLLKSGPKATLMVLYASAGNLNSILDLMYRKCDDTSWLFDLVILDEAHFSTGVLDEASKGNWKQIHKLIDNYCDYMVSMTATERTFDDEIESHLSIYSHHNFQQYGEVAYEMSFCEAVSLGLLADYSVYGMFHANIDVNEVRGIAKKAFKVKANAFIKAMEGNLKIDHTWESFSRDVEKHEIFRAWCVLVAIKKEKRRRILAFFNTISEMFRFNLLIQSLSELNKAPVKLAKDQVWAVYSGMSEDEEQRIYERFSSSFKKPVIVSSVDKLTTGVDFPAADMAALIEPRRGEIRLPQTVGRVTRRDGDKKALVFIPGYLDEDGNLLESDTPSVSNLQNSLKSVISVLSQMQRVDKRMEQVIASLNNMEITSKSIRLESTKAPEVRVDLPPSLFTTLKGLTVREASGEMSRWEYILDSILEKADAF